MPLSAGDKFPEGVKFDWAPILDDDPTVCGRPQEYDTSKEFKGKKVVLVSVPGAFTPACSSYHLPPYVQKYKELKSKGVDILAFIMSNDPFVANAWGKTNKVPANSDFLMLSDSKGFSKEHGWMAGMGDRGGRYAIVIEKDGTISYAANEESPVNVEVSSVDTVLSKL